MNLCRGARICGDALIRAGSASSARVTGGRARVLDESIA